ncbi:hypothetical protein Syun_007548 [Stephania yunnanensis]|uniref:Uncharacterized protein n=1 Tax=Stephania yunnanensis TaxID=152371 RepID=A0AAP0L0E5_9MAGN
MIDLIEREKLDLMSLNSTKIPRARIFLLFFALQQMTISSLRISLTSEYH